MSFIPKMFDRGKICTLPMGASAVATKWGLMKMSSGYLVAGASGDDEVEYIALQTKTDATAVAGGSLVDVLRIDETIVFDALVSTTPVQATHVGNNYDISAVGTVDLGATTDKVFHIDSIVDATNKIVRGRFNKPAIA
jgi:hypothetical protein